MVDVLCDAEWTLLTKVDDSDIRDMTRDAIARKLAGSKRNASTYRFVNRMIEYGVLVPTAARKHKNGHDLLLYTKSGKGIGKMLRSMGCFEMFRRNMKLWELNP